MIESVDIAMTVAVSASVVATLLLIIGTWATDGKKSKQITHTDRPERQAGYKPDWVLLDEKTGAGKNIVTICRNCGANLNGRGKCEYCGTVYPENIFLLTQEEDAEARKRVDKLVACGLLHTELSEIDEDIKHIQAEIDKMRG